MRAIITALSVLLATSVAQAEPSKEETPSGRLFLMPIADVVGPYQASLSYEGSLLKEPGVLSSAGVLAIGIGDLAQLEYRHTSAIGIKGKSAPLPAVGLQIKLPIPQLKYVPDLAVAYRLGIEHEEEGEQTKFTERVTDVYGVARFRFPKGIMLHLGLRLSQAEIGVSDNPDMGGDLSEIMWLPAFGLEVPMSERSVAIAEIGAAPKFSESDDGSASVDSGYTARLGLRWRVHPKFSFDASAGYLSSDSAAASEVLEWDIRLGAEVFVAWDSLTCRSLQLFCKKDKK